MNDDTQQFSINHSRHGCMQWRGTVWLRNPGEERFIAVDPYQFCFSANMESVNRDIFDCE